MGNFIQSIFESRKEKLFWDAAAYHILCRQSGTKADTDFELSLSAAPGKAAALLAILLGETLALAVDAP